MNHAFSQKYIDNNRKKEYIIKIGEGSMGCTNCGAELPAESNFCTKCGSAVVQVDHREKYALKTESSEAAILLEGGCTFFYFNPNETDSEGSDCKFQLTENSIKFVPNGILSPFILSLVL